mmetsp:Transcript_32376/g.76145  ORF Transcript_32376/g.76145 Transcript_32376/m.76145 type:complete len:907 (-) Transcript_32376:1135-3855(-)
MLLSRRLFALWSGLLPLVATSLPLGFVREVVVRKAAVSGVFASNPRNNGKPMLILASDSGRVNVAENPDESDEVVSILHLRLDDEELCTNGERGLQTAIPHPDFEENLWIYVFYTSYREGCLEGVDVSPHNVVERFRMDPETLQLDKATAEVIWRGAPTAKQNHNGGALAFGNDGKLYITTGDGGNNDSVQPLDNTHGSIIRLNDDGSVPSDNPFVGDGHSSYRCADSGGVVPEDAPEGALCAEVFANGLRNPFRITMDPSETQKTRFAVSDVGGSYWEEINWAGTDYAGRNYGYPKHEGPCLHGHSNRCQLPSDNNVLEPFHWYSHRKIQEGGCVSASVFVPEDSGWPSHYTMLFADFIFFEIYNLMEDPDKYCRSCRPPIPGYTNETFYTVPPTDEEDSERGSITDIFFGPYKDTQALYVLLRGTSENVIRIRYTGDVDNLPPIPLIQELEDGYDVGDEIEFDGSKSTDPDGDELEFVWDFGDGTTASDEKKPTHTFRAPGKYQVSLAVTDAEGISQQASVAVSVGTPPTASISSPEEGDVFYTGQVLTLKGKGFDSNGDRLRDSQLSWEVRKHHADHFHPFLDPTNGNGIELFPAPEPEDFFASTNSYLRIILTATDKDGLTTEVDRIVMPWKINVDIESHPSDIEVTVDAFPLKTSETIVSWMGHKLNVLANDQPPYHFREWWDGNTEQERRIELTADGQVIKALYCAQDYWLCMSDDECCSNSCVNMACTSSGGDVLVINGDVEEQDGNDSDSNAPATEVEVIDEGVSDSQTGTTESETSLAEDRNGLGATATAFVSIACLLLLVYTGMRWLEKTSRNKKLGAAGVLNKGSQQETGVPSEDNTDEEQGSVNESNSNHAVDVTHEKTASKETSDTSSKKESGGDVLNDTFETSSSESSIKLD